MPQSLAKILVHGIVSTKESRLFLREPAFRVEVHRYLGGIFNQLDAKPLIVGGVEDHVHFRTRLSRTSSVADLITELKRGSSLWMDELLQAFQA